MKQQKQNKNIIIILNKNKQSQIKIELDNRILKFGLPPLQSQDYNQPFELPQQVATTQFPFDFIIKFAQVHMYDPSSPKIKLPISTTNYKQIVDKFTYQICQRYTNLQYADQAQEILKLVKWIQFKQVQQAIAAAVATNYYTGYDQRQIQQFVKKNKLDQLTPEQIELIYEENKDLFNRIEQKTKQQFLKAETHQQQK